MTTATGTQAINPLGMVTLGLLTEGPLHPYEMFQVLMQRREDLVVKIRPTSLYHTVAKLESLGLVRALCIDRGGNRPERTTYEITVEGRKQLRAAVAHRLAVPENEYPLLPVAIAQASRLPKDEVLQHLEHRRQVVIGELAEFRSGYQAFIDSGKPLRWALDIHYLIAMRDSEVSWLTHTIDSLRSGDLEWTAP